MRYVLIILLALIIFIVGLLYTNIVVYIRYKDKIPGVRLSWLGFKFDLKLGDEKPKSENAEPEGEKQPRKENELLKKLKDNISEDFLPPTKFKDENGKFDITLFSNTIAGYKESFKLSKRLIWRFFGYLRYKVSFKRLDVQIMAGTGDAAQTGMLYGGIHALFWSCYPVFRQYFYIPRPTLTVIGDYNRKVFEIEIESIIKVRPAHIINAAILTGFTYLKHKRKGSVENG